MIDGPLEKARPHRGGAVYNSAGVQFIGYSNVVDGLYAVKKAVFEDGVMSPGELAACVSDDWEDAEDRGRTSCTGSQVWNDNDEVDAVAVRVLDHFCDEVSKLEHYRGARSGGRLRRGFHITMGAFAAPALTGATPARCWATVSLPQWQCPQRPDGGAQFVTSCRSLASTTAPIST